MGLQFATGFTVAFLTYQLGTLITAGSFGEGFLPGLIVVMILVCIVAALIRNSGRNLAAEFSLRERK